MKKLELKPTEENIVKTIEEDIFHRNNELKCFYELLISQNDGYTIAIDGKWGSGKTFFIKQEIMLINSMNPMVQGERHNLDIVKNMIMKIDEPKYDEIKMNMKAVYYDAWQNDNDIDPIVSLICEISKQTKKFNDTKKFDLVKSGTAIVDHFMKTNISQIYNSIKSESYFEYLIDRKNLEDDFKEFFDGLCDENCNRIVIFIDELDRCKPSYAVKLLEQVKHYMDDDRITFVFALNTLELQHTIRQFYGYDFDASRYLDRFFDIRTSLTNVDVNKYCMKLGISDADMIDVVGRIIINEYKLGLREVARYATHLNLIKSSLNNNNIFFYDGKVIQIVSVIIAPLIIVLHMTDIDMYNSFINGENMEPLLRLYNAAPEDFYWLINSMLNKDESIENVEGKREVTADVIIKRLYEAVFGNPYSRNYDNVKLGQYTFRRSAKEYALKISGLLTDGIKYDE